MAKAARTKAKAQDDTLMAEVAAEPVAPAAASPAADAWEWEPADPAEVPSDPTPVPETAQTAPGLEPTLDDYLNLALIGIAGLSLAILLTRPRR